MSRTSLLVLALLGCVFTFVVTAADPHTFDLKPTTTFDSGLHATAREVRFSANGKTVAKACESVGLEVWDLTTGKLLGGSEDGKSPAPSDQLAVSPDGRVAYIGLSDKVLIWDCISEKLSATIGSQGKRTTATEITAIALHPDGKCLALALEKGGVQIWDSATNKRRSRLEATGKVWAVAYSGDGRFLVGRGDHGALVWDAKTEKLLHEFKTKGRGPDDPIIPFNFRSRVAASPDGKWVAFGTWRGRFSVWSVADAKEVATVPGKLAEFSGDGKYLYVLDRDRREKELTVFDVAHGKAVLVATLSAGLAHCMTVSPDGKTLAVGYDQGQVRLYDTKDLLPAK